MFAYNLSKHAQTRMAQRNLKPAEVKLVIKHGRSEYRAGAKFFFLGRRDIPKGKEKVMECLIGVTIVTSGETILTVYQNKRAIAEIKRKPKRSVYAHSHPAKVRASFAVA